MKIYLLNAPPSKIRGDIGLIYPPMGILYLAAYARKNMGDLKIKVVDGLQKGFKKTVKDIYQFNPDVLGVSYTTQAASGAYSLINEVKSNDKELFVISGGPHPTAMPTDVLIRSETDTVVLGEGEITFLELIKEYDQTRSKTNDIFGTVQKNDEEIKYNPLRPLIKDLDEIPFPARDLLDIKSYPGYYVKKRRRDTSYISTRGCPYKCVFCSNPVWKVSKPYIRLRSPKNVVDEIEHLVNRYNIHEFFDETDEFNVSLKWSKQVCDEIIERKLDIDWKVQMRADKIDDELAEKMAKSGCWMAFVGIESGNNDTLKGIRKNIKVEQVNRALDILKRHGIKTFGTFMTFNLWEENGKLSYENMEKTKNSLKFATDLIEQKKLDFMTWSLTTPFPGSELYDIVLRHKIIPEDLIGKWDEWEGSTNFIINLDGVSEKDWIETRNMGASIQAKQLLKSGNMNLAAASLYARRGLQMIGRTVKKYIG